MINNTNKIIIEGGEFRGKYNGIYIPEGMQIDFISDDVYNLNKFNIIVYSNI